MTAYSYIDSDDGIRSLIPSFERKGRIAVDFEGEFNLHIYGEHLCLIQIFDGENFFLIDPRAPGVTEKGLEAFFLSDTEKIFFDVQSDASLVHKRYGIVIFRIYDIRIPAVLMGYTGNLRGLEERYLGIPATEGKKRNQTSNWLVRPLDPVQIEYALSDVAHLLELKDILDHEMEVNGLQKECAGRMKRAVAVKTPSPPWKKIGDWRRMTKSEKVYVKQIFIARDSIAKRFNVPAVRVMEKHMITELASDPPVSMEALEKRLEKAPPRFRKMLVTSLWSALEKGREELSGNKR